MAVQSAGCIYDATEGYCTYNINSVRLLLWYMHLTNDLRELRSLLVRQNRVAVLRSAKLRSQCTGNAFTLAVITLQDLIVCTVVTCRLHTRSFTSLTAAALRCARYRSQGLNSLRCSRFSPAAERGADGVRDAVGRFGRSPDDLHKPRRDD